MTDLSAPRISALALAALGSCAAPERASLPVVVTVAAPAERAPAASPKGFWRGTLHLRDEVIEVQFRIDPDAVPAAKACVMDFVDRRVFGYACRLSRGPDGRVILGLTDTAGWKGTVPSDDASLDGTWTQGEQVVSFVMKREAVPIDPPKAQTDPALPPTDLNTLKAVLDADMAETLARGELAPSTGGGVVIGVVHHGVRKIFAYGTAKTDSLFEIGSITKTFTGLLLAQRVQQNKVRLDEPIRELLPPGTVAKPATGLEITLLDLSDHHSGLPRLPDNFKPADPTNPYVDYDPKALFTWLAKQGVARSADAPYEYSNVGVGLLGEALALHARVTYEALLRQEITGPLGMHDTVITMTAPQRARLAEGHNFERKPAHAWDFDALGGVGAIRSTADDMLTYLEAQIHPDKLPASVSRSAAGKTLGAAITASHVVHAPVGDGAHIALNWFRNDESGSFSHEGQTGGYTAVAEFSSTVDIGIVVLSNTVADSNFVGRISDHVAERMSGLAAVSIALPATP